MTMTRRGQLLAMTAALGLVTAGRALAADNPFHGTWTGLLEGPDLILRLVIEADKATLISVDQGGGQTPASQVAVEGPHIRLAFRAINASFEGTLSGDRIEGVFTQGQAIKMRFTRGDVADLTPMTVSPALTEALLEARRAEAGAPALGAAWARGIASTVMVAGSRSSKVRAPLRAEDQWHWGSITKPMTATLCARLVEAGVIGWDTTIGQVLDEKGAQVPAAYRDATLLHLLSHRAGLRPNVTGVEFSFELLDAREERLRFARTAFGYEPAAAVGAAMIYSNNGYVVAGAMLEKLTGKTWETLIQSEVFAPLGVRRAGQGTPGTRGLLDQPLGHTVKDGKREPDPAGTPGSDNPAAIGPSGRVHMPLADMLRYLEAHRDRPGRFLGTQSWDKLHTPPFGGNYALGWMVRKDGSLWHNGSNTMWYGEALVDPKAGVVCAACANDATEATKTAVAETLASARAAALL